LSSLHPLDATVVWFIHIHQEMTEKCSKEFRNAKNQDQVGTPLLDLLAGFERVSFSRRKI